MRIRKKRRPFEIKDPLAVRAREAALRVLVCSWRGHSRRTSFSGWKKSCDRCGR